MPMHDDAESLVVEKTRQGLVADLTILPGFSVEAKPQISAQFLRNLLLGLGENPSVMLPGVRVKGARIEGDLDLNDSRGAGGGGLPTLTLEHCDLSGRIEFREARFSRLSLRRSRFRELWAASMCLDGDLDLNGISPLPIDGEPSVLYLRLRGARIGGDLWIAGAQLRAPQTVPSGLNHVPDALQLQSASISGNVILQPFEKERFIAHGTVNFRGANIGRNLVARGAEFRTIDGLALRAEEAEIQGYVDLSSTAEARFDATGKVTFYGASIGGSLDLSGARISSPNDAALVCGNASIGGDLDLCMAGGHRVEMHGTVSLDGAKVGQSIRAWGAQLDGAGKTALGAGGIVVAGDVDLSADDECRFSAKGSVLLTASHVRGSLDFRGAQFSADEGYAIDCVNIDVGGDAYFATDGEYPFEATGMITLAGAKIGRDLNASGAVLKSAEGPAFYAGYAEIGGQANFSSKDNHRFLAEGGIDLESASIGRSIFFWGSRVVGESFAAIDCSNASIGGDMFLASLEEFAFEAEGTVQLVGAKVGQNLLCWGSRLDGKGHRAFAAKGLVVGGDLQFASPGEIRLEANGAVDIPYAKIGGWLIIARANLLGTDGDSLTADNSEVRGDLSVIEVQHGGQSSLSGMKVGRLADDPATGWQGCQRLNLGEMTYDQIFHYGEKNSWASRARWLRLNSERGADFSKQPWRECAAALARAGQHRSARRIAREEQREANRHNPIWKQPFVWLFAELGFGYGLSVSRSILTLILFWVVGTIGAATMQSRGVLVSADEPTQICAGVDPALFALDAAIPLLDLRQESMCRAGRLPGAKLIEGGRLPGTQIYFGDEVTIWTWARALYSIAGALLIGFAGLTYSGVFKPKGS